MKYTLARNLENFDIRVSKELGHCPFNLIDPEYHQDYQALLIEYLEAYPNHSTDQLSRKSKHHLLTYTLLYSKPPPE